MGLSTREEMIEMMERDVKKPRGHFLMVGGMLIFVLIEK